MLSGEIISKTINIHAPVALVLEALTTISMMKLWMAEPEMELEITTDWKVGNPITTKGFHHIKFENKGKVLEFQPNKTLRYNYLSSLSRLPDQPENYTEIEFRLTPFENETTLTLTLTNFPTETIYHHSEFYWNGTLEILKRLIEKQ